MLMKIALDIEDHGLLDLDGNRSQIVSPVLRGLRGWQWD